MLEISGKTNLLEQNAYKYSLQDVAEPNLQRDIYTQGMVPKVPFNHRRVPMNMPEEIWITDTSLRDGQQSVEPYTVDQIVNIYKYLSRLGGPYGIIRQTEFFIYSKKDREALEKCMELGLKFPEITTWIRATKEDFRLVRDLGIRETGILVSCSDYHIFKKMKMTRKQAMDYYLATVADAFEAGVVPRCHLEDITRADFYGFVVPFVNELQKLSRQAGIPVKIRACDTMGYGIPYTEAALPRSVAGIIYGLQQYSDVPMRPCRVCFLPEGSAVAAAGKTASAGRTGGGPGAPHSSGVRNCGGPFVRFFVFAVQQKRSRPQQMCNSKTAKIVLFFVQFCHFWAGLSVNQPKFPCRLFSCNLPP